jgi:hypothetical protein
MFEKNASPKDPIQIPGEYEELHECSKKFEIVSGRS